MTRSYNEFSNTAKRIFVFFITTVSAYMWNIVVYPCARCARCGVCSHHRVGECTGSWTCHRDSRVKMSHDLKGDCDGRTLKDPSQNCFRYVPGNTSPEAFPRRNSPGKCRLTFLPSLKISCAPNLPLCRTVVNSRQKGTRCRKGKILWSLRCILLRRMAPPTSFILRLCNPSPQGIWLGMLSGILWCQDSWFCQTRCVLYNNIFQELR